MNIHPIFVHFPIALLSIYSVMEIIRFQKIVNSNPWPYIKATFVILGYFGASAAILTGEAAGEQYLGGRNLVETHERFAQLTELVYGLIALAYLIALFDQWGFSSRFQQGWLKLWTIASRYKTFILKPRIVVTLAVLGLLLVLTTGGLGAILVYGPENDPFTQLLYKLIFR